MSDKSQPLPRIIVIFLVLLLSLTLLGCKWMSFLADIINGMSVQKSYEINILETPEGEPPQLTALPSQPTSVVLPVAPAGNLPLKPVHFRNLGTVPYTVSAWSYLPPGSSIASIPSDASTVASPGGNPSSYLSLPLGTYTWCYWWEIGDINTDGTLEYAHAIDERTVTLDASDSDTLEFAETVDLSAPAENGAQVGTCGLEITPYIVSQSHVDNLSGALINMGHDYDNVTLRGPVTVTFWYIHAAQEIREGVPREITQPVVVVIPVGETHTFELVDGREDHPGDWNMYIMLISIDE